mmetsp:Transcript_94886/g.245011  ORF Transcript_94886/g.245011 Transcript_94886/m.245011 type:complete len:206 (-) Transcript_94886:9-626(-)
MALQGATSPHHTIQADLLTSFVHLLLHLRELALMRLLDLGWQVGCDGWVRLEPPQQKGLYHPLQQPLVLCRLKPRVAASCPDRRRQRLAELPLEFRPIVGQVAWQDELELGVEVGERVLDRRPAQGDAHRAHSLRHELHGLRDPARVVFDLLGLIQDHATEDLFLDEALAIPAEGLIRGKEHVRLLQLARPATLLGRFSIDCSGR